MTTALTAFISQNEVGSINLLRPSSKTPSPDETLGVTINAWTQAQQVEITPTPRGTTHAEHFLHSRRTALQHAAKAVYIAAFEHATPALRNELLQFLHQDRLTLTEWAHNQARPTLTEIDRTALRREYNSRFGFPIITKAAVQWIANATAGNPLLEIGAGNGYLASELIQHGVDLITTDPHPTGAEDGYRIPMAPVPSVDILPLTGTEAMAIHPDHNILWSWPDLNAEYYPPDPPGVQGTVPRLHRRGYLRQHRLKRVPRHPRRILRPDRLLPDTNLPGTPRPHHPLPTDLTNNQAP